MHKKVNQWRANTSIKATGNNAGLFSNSCHCPRALLFSLDLSLVETLNNKKGVQIMRSIIEYRNSLRSNQDFNPNEIVEKYKEFVAQNRVFRSLCQKHSQIKTFGLRNRSGLHESSDTSRSEEKLCQALFNTFSPEKDDNENIAQEGNTTRANTPWSIPNYSQYIVDYQTPLKNTAHDKLWGKFDLIGLIQGSPKKHLCLWEVKCGQNGDSIHFAIMELLIYYAQFDLTSTSKDDAKRNYQNFLLEAALVRGAGLMNNIVTIHQDNLPVLFIAADGTYFDYQNWQSRKPVYIKLKQVIEKELKLKLEFLQIGTECYHENDRYFYKRDNTLGFLL